jgi:hypothetical protein
MQYSPCLYSWNKGHIPLLPTLDLVHSYPGPSPGLCDFPCRLTQFFIPEVSTPWSPCPPKTMVAALVYVQSKLGRGVSRNAQDGYLRPLTELILA